MTESFRANGLPIATMRDIELESNLQRWTAISAMALIGVTYRLWIPHYEFPQVPAFEVLCNAPAWIDWVCLVSLIAGLLIIVFGRFGRWSNCGYLLVLVTLIAIVSLDQHRFQPWAYQLWLFAAIRLCCGANLGLRLMRWLMISIYCYSALGKFDFEFLHSVGQQMLGALAKLLGQDLSAMPNWLRLGLVAAFPLCEFAIAIGLAMPKSRRVFGFFAIGLHLSLILVLGPFGLGHRLGVLLWNIQFAVQAYFLFVVRQCACDGEIRSEQLVAHESRKHTFSPGHCIGVALIAMVIVMPITERFGIWDHWPSWALYAPHSSRVRIEVAPSAIARLPAGLGVLIDKSTAEADELPDWVAVPIDAWSLSSLDTPIYPQSRFQLGVAKQIASEVSSEFQIRITLLGCANRFTGLRKSEVIEGTSKIVDAGAGFWFNTRPRWRAGK